MKKTLILLMFPVLSFGQSYDSLRQSILRLQSEQNSIKINLAKHKEQHSLGTSLFVGGIAMFLVNVAMQKKDPNQRQNDVFLIISSVTTVAGAAIQIDSHKWIGRAGTGRRKRR